MFIRKQSLKACCWFSIFDVGTIWYKTIRIGQVEMIKKTFKSWIKVFRCVCVGGGGGARFLLGKVGNKVVTSWQKVGILLS